MFFFPFGTDAPIYHYPIGTGVLIAVNVLVFFLVATGQIDPQTADSLILHFHELNPLEWLTTNFMHADFWHLLGNMFFLWGFGLVVEGKLGWYRFVPIYLLIGILYGGLVQAIMLGAVGGALGASGVLFGLIGMAVVWAPKNEINCFFVVFIFFLVRVFTFSMTIVNFGGLFLGLQIVSFWLENFSMSSAALHLAGFAIGFPIGLLMLKLDWVDCEGWDLINVWKGQHRKDAIALREEAEALVRETADAKDNQEAERATALELLRTHLKDGHPEVAYAVFQKTVGASGNPWPLPQAELLALVNFLHQQKKWSESLPLMVDMLKRFSEQTAPARLKLAQILVQVEERPKQALAVLAKLPEQLPPQLDGRRRQIQALAEAAIEDGAVEFDMQDW
jgi:membrane associated rhomboid family serine protease